MEIMLTPMEISELRAIQQEISSVPGELRALCDNFRAVSSGPVMTNWGTTDAGAACIRRINTVDTNLNNLANSIASTNIAVDALCQRAQANNQVVL